MSPSASIRLERNTKKGKKNKEYNCGIDQSEVVARPRRLDARRAGNHIEARVSFLTNTIAFWSLNISRHWFDLRSFSAPLDGFVSSAQVT